MIENYPEGQVEELEAVNNPEDPAAGTRKVPFSRVLYIERDDFREDPPQEVLPPGARPRGAAALRATSSRCTGVVKDPATGEVVELRCTYDPATPRRRRARRPQGQGDAPLGVGRARASPPRCGSTTASSRVEDPDAAEGDFRDYLNPTSLERRRRRQVEPALAGAAAGQPLPVRAPGLLLRRSRRRRRAGRSSTAPSPCGTPGRRSRRRARESRSAPRSVLRGVRVREGIPGPSRAVAAPAAQGAPPTP